MAALPPQAIELQDIVLPLVGLTNAGPMASCQTVQFMALHGLSSIKDFNLIIINLNSRSGIGRSRRPCPSCMGGITALLRMSSGLTSRRGETLMSTL